MRRDLIQLARTRNVQLPSEKVGDPDFNPPVRDSKGRDSSSTTESTMMRKVRPSRSCEISRPQL